MKNNNIGQVYTTTSTSLNVYTTHTTTYARTRREMQEDWLDGIDIDIIEKYLRRKKLERLNETEI